MRPHILKCLTARKLINENKPKQCRFKSVKLKLYCSCGMYCVPSDEKISGR